MRACKSLVLDGSSMCPGGEAIGSPAWLDFCELECLKACANVAIPEHVVLAVPVGFAKNCGKRAGASGWHVEEVADYRAFSPFLAPGSVVVSRDWHFWQVLYLHPKTVLVHPTGLGDISYTLPELEHAYGRHSGREVRLACTCAASDLMGLPGIGNRVRLLSRARRFLRGRINSNLAEHRFWQRDACRRMDTRTSIVRSRFPGGLPPFDCASFTAGTSGRWRGLSEKVFAALDRYGIKNN